MKKISIIFLLSISVVLLSNQNSYSLGTLPENPGYQSAESKYKCHWRDDLFVEAFDGVKLAINIFNPEPLYEGEKFPVILMPNSWLLEEHEYIIQGAKLCKKGYIVLEYSVRGWGISGGLVNVGGSNDMKDISTLIDWVINNYSVEGVEKDEYGNVIDDTDAKIGMCGTSLGGGLGLLGAAHDLRIKVVMSTVPWGDLVSALYMNQTTKEVWHKIILTEMGNIIGNLDPEILDLTDELFDHNQEEYFDYILDWSLERSPIKFLDKLNYVDGHKRDLAICLSNNLQDEMFPPNQILRFYYGLKLDKKRLDFNRGVHGSAEATGMAGLPNEVWNKIHAWFDENFKHIDTGIMDLKQISINDKRSSKRYYVDHVFLKNINIDYLKGIYEEPETNQIDPEKFYLGYRPWYSLYGKLSNGSQKTSKTNTIHSGPFSGISIGFPIIGSLLEAHTNTLQIKSWFPATNKGKSIIYISPKLERDRTIIGAPYVKLKITPTTPTFQLIAHLYTLEPNGTGTLFSNAPLTILNNGELMPNASPGKEMEVEFNFIATCLTVQKGQRIALAIDTEDLNYGKAPDKDFELKFGYNEDTVLSIPFIN